MTEQEFWAYCDELRKDPGGDRLPREMVILMGELLLQKGVSHRTQATIMMTLAHQWRSKEALKYLKAYREMQEDEGMRIFTQFAVEECQW